MTEPKTLLQMAGAPPGVDPAFDKIAGLLARTRAAGAPILQWPTRAGLTTCSIGTAMPAPSREPSGRPAST